jgi:hypothetical protein
MRTKAYLVKRVGQVPAISDPRKVQHRPSCKSAKNRFGMQISLLYLPFYTSVLLPSVFSLVWFHGLGFAITERRDPACFDA